MTSRGHMPGTDTRIARRMGLQGALAVATLLGGCGTAGEAVFAELVVDAPGATGEGYGDPGRAVNGVRGGGTYTGSLDVYSLDYLSRRSITLAVGGHAIVDGPGPELVVFENGFREATREAHFMDPVVVEVSLDGESWLAFPHDYVARDETVYEPHPEAWEGFAGVTPVLLHAETNPIDAFDPRAGGDAFDLAELAGSDATTSALASRLRTEGARFVRLTSAALWVNPDTGAPFPRDAVSDGADIDGVAARHLVVVPDPR